MIRLADGKFWTKYSQGTAIQANAGSLCSGKGSLPTAQQFVDLLKSYGGYANTAYRGSPYGYSLDSTNLYDLTGWDGVFWSSTQQTNSAGSNSYGWILGVNSIYGAAGYSITGYLPRTLTYNVLCVV